MWLFDASNFLGWTLSDWHLGVRQESHGNIPEKHIKKLGDY